MAATPTSRTPRSRRRRAATRMWPLVGRLSAAGVAVAVLHAVLEPVLRRRVPFGAYLVLHGLVRPGDVLVRRFADVHSPIVREVAGFAANGALLGLLGLVVWWGLARWRPALFVALAAAAAHAVVAVVTFGYFR